MYQRSNSYDGIKTVVNSLREIKDHQSNILIKSRDGLNEFVEDIEQIDMICKGIACQFNDLRSDFNSGKINRARYQDHLKPIKDFLDDNPDFNYQAMPLVEIRKEIAKFW